MAHAQSSSKPNRLEDAEIERRLQALPEWSHSGDQLQRTYVFADFLASMRFVNAISARAEEVQHHPDMLVRWNRVTLSLSTHDAGGISEKDFAFASDADRIS
ncbi:MAG: 4a-hydroxytetrahydrobiopterin dehydratase [Phycisphaerales bacterium]|nr:4a-hydroxytetrahydrobiopterin dehydratase [Phycisphaerales bacterium]